MSINLSGRALKRLRLPVVNYYSSAYQVMSAQAGDVNTRYLDVVLYDDRGDIDLSAYSKVYLQVQAYDGISPQMSEGWIDTERNRAVCRLTSSMLQYTGSKMPCNIWLVGTDADDEPMSLTSQTFYVMVYEGHGGADAEPSEDELTALQSAINDVVELEKTVGEAEANRQENFRSVYIKYSFDASGYNYTDSWQQGQQYMGVANTPKEPEDATGYSWILISGGSSGGSAVTVVGKNGYGFYRLAGEYTVDTTNVATEDIQRRADREVQAGDMLITPEGLIFVLDEYDADNDTQKVSYYTDIGGGDVSEEAIAAAVEMYMSENEIDGSGADDIDIVDSDGSYKLILTKDGEHIGSGVNMPAYTAESVGAAEKNHDHDEKYQPKGNYAAEGHDHDGTYIKQTELNGAVDTALQTAKESGEFDGEDGVDGGHYTPSVRDNGNGTMTVSFTSSKSGMPSVNPITITLPVGKDGTDGNDGDDGADGGYYTPSVQTVAENTFKISFTASKSGMPAVGDVTITLPTADDGDDGVGIESIVQTTTSTVDGGENVITVTLTNGDKSTFAVKNGSKGSKGDAGNGIKSIAKTSTSGLVDTYTITFTDNTTTTFTVTNGKAGTSVTISSVTESTESGGSNVVNFSDGKSVTIKNGKDGKDYILTDDDKTEIIQEILAELGAAVIGYIDGNTITVKGNLAEGVYTAYYEVDGELVEIGELALGVEPVTYTITWKNDDGSVLKTDTVKEGTVPSYSGATPTKASDGQYNYTFKAWSPTIVAATANATYTATYNQTAIEVETYRVTFVADGTTVATVTYEKGATSVEEPAVPEKTGYTGAWKPYTLNNTNITVEAEYTAKTYTITWNVDGVETSETYKYGDEPSFKGSTDKAADDQYTYTFREWSPAITTVTGNKTYTAQYTQTAIEVEPTEPTNFFKATPTVSATSAASQDAVVLGGRLGGDSTYRADGGPDCLLTNYIPVQSGDIVEMTNLAFNSVNSAMYKSDNDKTLIGAFQSSNTAYVTNVSTSGKTQTFTVSHANAGYIRISGKPDNGIKVNQSGADVSLRYDLTQIVIKVKHNGVYL